jgi:hypothetical protein
VKKAEYHTEAVHFELGAECSWLAIERTRLCMPSFHPETFLNTFAGSREVLEIAVDFYTVGHLQIGVPM